MEGFTKGAAGGSSSICIFCYFLGFVSDSRQCSYIQPLIFLLQHERACLDSMVLLLIKLDQLDQEIQNALSTTSSMDSSPTLQRWPPRVGACTFSQISSYNGNSGVPTLFSWSTCRLTICVDTE